ncbi:hypothetical protein ACOKWN_002332 [Vibrio parahaemolyticus]
MKLDRYVEETIKQIIDGVGAASEYAASKGASVNPIAVGGEKSRLFVRGRDLIPVHEIEFHVVVSVTESQTTATPEITVGSVTQGSSGSNSEAINSSNTIKFSIPIALPVG